jgi:hypothetical protein
MTAIPLHNRAMLTGSAGFEILPGWQVIATVARPAALRPA